MHRNFTYTHCSAIDIHTMSCISFLKKEHKLLETHAFVGSRPLTLDVCQCTLFYLQCSKYLPSTETSVSPAVSTRMPINDHPTACVPLEAISVINCIGSAYVYSSTTFQWSVWNAYCTSSDRGHNCRPRKFG